MREHKIRALLYMTAIGIICYALSLTVTTSEQLEQGE
jgi:hypothetical protein